MIDFLLPPKSLPHINWKINLIIIVSTLILITSHYNRIFPSKEVDHLFYYLVLPLALVIFVLRENPARYGFQIGDWKAGLIFTGIGLVSTFVIMYFVAQTSDFKGYYASQARPLLQLSINTGLDLIGWEFLFRGLLLFALLPVCGPYAILIQAIPFTIAHFGKPELETLSCIFGGSIFGLIAWRTRSFLYPFFIHWFLAIITILFAATTGS